MPRAPPDRREERAQTWRTPFDEPWRQPATVADADLGPEKAEEAREWILEWLEEHGRSYMKDEPVAWTQDTFKRSKLLFDDTDRGYTGTDAGRRCWPAPSGT